MRIYADTSFLVSLYCLDAHSGRAATEIRRLNPLVLLTPIGELELTNALELRIFRKEATASAIRKVQAKLQEHIEAGFFSQEAMPLTAYERARKIARQRTPHLGVRTLDILHVASALILGAERFLTFDDRQKELAEQEGLKTN